VEVKIKITLTICLLVGVKNRIRLMMSQLESPKITTKNRILLMILNNRKKLKLRKLIQNYKKTFKREQNMTLEKP
jgi:hypothetical protein